MNAPPELSLFLCFAPPKIDNTRMREELVHLIIERLDRDSDSIRADFAATKDVTAHYTASEQKIRRIVTKLDSDLRSALRKFKKDGFGKKDIYENKN